MMMTMMRDDDDNYVAHYNLKELRLQGPLRKESRGTECAPNIPMIEMELISLATMSVLRTKKEVFSF